MADEDFPVKRDVAKKYLLDHERREEKIKALLGGARQTAIYASEIPEDRTPEESIDYLILRLIEVNFKLDAILTSFSIGEVDPEEPPPGA